ncbi:MAG: hypothetical protein AB7R67_23760 [Vicinamibacterales bacterium]
MTAFDRTPAQAVAAASIRRELPGLLWRFPAQDGAVRYESDSEPAVCLVVQADGGLSTPVAIAQHARQWRAEHPDSDRIYGYVPRTARIVADAIGRLP